MSDVFSRSLRLGGRKASLPAAAAAAAMALPLLAAPSVAQACNGDGTQLIGSICMVGFTFCPRGYTEAAGQTMAISENQALFSLLGTTYGGDGRTTFALPDLRGRVPVGIGTGPGLTPVQMGQTRGAERRTITEAQMPSHSHVATADFNPQGGAEVKVSINPGERASAQAGDYLGKANAPTMGGAGVNLYTGAGPGSVALSGVSGGGGSVTVRNQNTGGSQPLETLDPGLGIRYCIALDGIYPSRP